MSKRKRSNNESTSSSNEHSIVVLNVGGVLMSTTRATLLAFPQSVIGRKFDEELKYGKPLTDKQGIIFLDCDPEAFKVILTYLRLGKFVKGKHLSPSLREQVCAEADYFGLTDLVSECNQASTNEDIKNLIQTGYQEKNSANLKKIQKQLVLLTQSTLSSSNTFVDCAEQLEQLASTLDDKLNQVAMTMAESNNTFVECVDELEMIKSTLDDKLETINDTVAEVLGNINTSIEQFH